MLDRVPRVSSIHLQEDAVALLSPKCKDRHDELAVDPFIAHIHDDLALKPFRFLHELRCGTSMETGLGFDRDTLLDHEPVSSVINPVRGRVSDEARLGPCRMTSVSLTVSSRLARAGETFV